MKIRIIDNKPRAGDDDITKLIGRVFTVKAQAEEGVYVNHRGNYQIYPDEYEVVEE